MVITEEVVIAALMNRKSGKEVMILLREKPGAEGVTTEVVLSEEQPLRLIVIGTFDSRTEKI